MFCLRQDIRSNVTLCAFSLVAMKYDYGRPEQGYSFEHYNFYHSLHHMGHDILYFDFMTLMQEHGKDWMNRRLLEVVEAEKPDMMFTVLFTEELDKAIVRRSQRIRTRLP